MKKIYYDCFINHRTSDRAWLDSLTHNLRRAGLQVFSDNWSAVPGFSFAEKVDTVRKSSKHEALIATPDAVASGWFRKEYIECLKRYPKGPFRSFTVIVAGRVRDIPILANSDWLDFRSSCADNYCEDLLLLVRRITKTHTNKKLRAEDVEVPLFRNSSPEPGPGELNLIRKVIEKGRDTPVVLVTSQECGMRYQAVDAIRAALDREHPGAEVLRFMLPYSAESEGEELFCSLGRQARLPGDIRDKRDWERVIVSRLRERSIFILIEELENGSAEGRDMLARSLHGIAEKNRKGLQIILFGGESLAKLKHEPGSHSLLSLGKEIRWPDPKVSDLLVWAEQDFPALPLRHSVARGILEACGWHSRLAYYYLQHLDVIKEALGDNAVQHIDGSKILDILRRDPRVWQFFSGVGREVKDIFSLVDQDDLGSFVFWETRLDIRRLYWSNLIRKSAAGRYIWRCSFLREVGKEVLGCCRR